MARLLPPLLLGALAATAASAQPQATPALGELLRRVAFRNSGTTQRTDRYSWQLIQPTGEQTFYYLEPQNVTAVHGLWGHWGTGTVPNSGRRYKFLLPPTPPTPSPPPPCKAGRLAPGKDIPGHDAGEVQLPAGGNVSGCEAACCAAEGCDAFVYTPNTPAPGLGACKADLSRPCCFLKRGGRAAPQVKCAPFGNTSYQGCVAVTMDTPDTSADGYVGTAPPSGIRSAVPLGGIGCGTVELRGVSAATVCPATHPVV